MRQSYIQYGETYQGKSWTSLPWTSFAENKINGNRVNYENLCFDKRRQLAALVMAEIMEGQGRFLPDIINGMGSFCEETWWGIPAHYNKRIPLREQQEVDLFNAETASLIAWTRYMLQTHFDKFSPDLCRRIDREIEQRILKPALTRNYWWKTAGMNWNPWICSNWLTCILISETDERRKTEAIAQIRQATQAFIDAYPDDGGCDEGPGYWDRAAASMFEVLRLLPDFSGDEAKIRRMAQYAYKTYIGHDYCVNFADAHENRSVQQVNIVYPMGLWLNDRTMTQFGAWLGLQKNILQRPAALYDKSGNFPTLGRELFFLRHIRSFMAEEPREPLLSDVWLPNLQIMTARRGNLFLAMKGGTNGESHNHNDVGSFIVYADNEPLLIDPGVGEYTAKTFGRDRYDIWTMQSQYHNLPIINGTCQHDGKQYAAKVLSHREGQLTLDIAPAYPPEAAVASWQRTLSIHRHAVTVTETYKLTECRQPPQLILMTPLRPSVAKGNIKLGSHGISYDGRQLEATVDDISQMLDPVLQKIWGKEMYRIILTVKSTKTNTTIKYTVK
ncbi:MAG: heparinase II/III-family protein [Prevotella sp.]|nr:heparinase II/III-family protein [Prevotella sp.]